MSSLARNIEPFVPSEQDAVLAKLSSRMLAPHIADNEFKIQLQDGTEVVLPAMVLRVLVDVLAQVSEGNAGGAKGSRRSPAGGGATVHGGTARDSSTLRATHGLHRVAGRSQQPQCGQ